MVRRPAGRQLLQGDPPDAQHLVVDRAYEGDDTRQLVLDFPMTPVVRPKQNRRQPWSYSEALYKTRNEVKRLFRRLKGHRRIFTRFDKLDVVFSFFVHLALIIEGISVNTP
jgi:transposase